MRRQRTMISTANKSGDGRCQLMIRMAVLCLGLFCQTTTAFVKVSSTPRSILHRLPVSVNGNILSQKRMASKHHHRLFLERQPQRQTRTTSSSSSTSLSISQDDVSSLGIQAAANDNNNNSGNTSNSGGSIMKETQLHSQSALLPSLFDKNAASAAAAMDKQQATEDVYTQAIERTLLWVGAALVFGTGLWVLVGPTTAEEFFAGYLVEQSLSVDNLFVFLVLFEYFKVPLSGQGRVLSWGIFGAVIMRAIMIGLGAAALQHFRELLLLFAAILIYSSANNLISLFSGPSDSEDDEDLSQNAIVKFSRSLFPSTDHFDGDKFFTVANGIKMATPLFICMIAVEVSDVVFAVDSIPAVFGVTENPLVVFTSNMFAIMGLRSLYTILSKAATDLKYLEPAVAVVLGFIGSKMVAEYLGFHIPTEAALGVVTSLLATGVGASVWEQEQELQRAKEADVANGHEESSTPSTTISSSKSDES